jgi:hypothetical protein
MVRVAAQDPMIGFVGSKIYYYDFAGKKDVFNTAGGMQNLGLGRTVLIGCRETDTGQYDTPRTVDFVSGACFLVRTEVLRTVGLLDPRYFAYWEENDLATRGVRAGYITVYAPGAKIWHKISVSTKNSTLKTYLLTRNTFWFERKFATKPQLLTFFLYFFLYQFWESTLYSLVVKRDVQLYRSFLRGLKDGLAPRQDQ